MAFLGELVASLELDTRGFKKGKKQMQSFEQQTARSTNRMRKSLSGLTTSINTVVGALAVREVGQFANDLKQTAVNAEETANKFDVLFGAVDRADTVVKDISERYDLATQTTKELLSVTGDLTQGFGMQKRQSLELASNVTRLGKDLASFQNVQGGAERATRALANAMLGERERLKSLGIVITENMVKQRLEKRNLDELTGARRMAAEAQIVYNMALEQSQNAIGDYLRTEQQMANRQRALKEQVLELKRTYGEALMPVFSELIKTANKWAQWLIENKDRVLAWASAIKKGAVIGLKTLTGWLTVKAFTSFTRWLRIAIPLTKNFGTALRTAAAAAKALGRAFLYYLVIEGIIWAIEKFKEFNEIVQETPAKWGLAAKVAADRFVNNIVNGIHGLAVWLGDVLHLVTDPIIAAFKETGKIAWEAFQGGFLPGITSGLNFARISAAMSQALENAWKAIGRHQRNIFDNRPIKIVSDEEMKRFKNYEKQVKSTSKSVDNLQSNLEKMDVQGGAGGMEKLGTLGFTQGIETTVQELDEMDRAVTTTSQRVGAEVQFISDHFRGMQNVISNALESSKNFLDAFGNFFSDFIQGLIIRVTSAMIATAAFAGLLSIIAPGITSGGGFGFIRAAGNLLGTSNTAKMMNNVIGGFASGGTVPYTGNYLVGEKGPEIVSMPGGAEVIPNHQLMGVNVKIEPAESRIKGEDIYLSYNEYSRKKSNTLG